ncbi:MAG: T9SS type A sorting domain-containing protein [bacterium]
MKTCLTFIFLVVFFSHIIQAQAVWDICGTGLPYGTVREIAINGNYIYAATYQGIYQSTNNGTNWTKKSNGITNDTIKCFAFSNNKVFAGTWAGVYMSTNNGDTWILKNSGLNGKIFSMTNIGSNIFAVVYNYLDGLSTGVYLSTDDGENWTKKSQGITSSFTSDIIAKENNLFLSTGDGMFMSTDLGENWVEKNNGLTIKDVRSITINDDKIFIGLQAGGVYMSTDNGEFWIPKKNGLELQSLWGYSLASYQNTIFLGTLGRGFFISSDFGENWILTNVGLGGNAIGTIATNNTYIYAGTDMGAFRIPVSEVIVDVNEINTESHFSIYPNPASDFISISDINDKIQIYDIMGREVWIGIINDGMRIDVSGFSQGVYYIISNKNQVTKNFMILR